MFKMFKVIFLLLGSALCVVCLGCTAASHQGKPMDQNRKPKVFLGVMDASCAEVETNVRSALKQSPDLGLEGEIDIPKGKGFKVPLREEKGRRWKALVKVVCNEPLSSTISVLVDAQKRDAGGKWREDPDTVDLEKSILNRLIPRPTGKTKKK